MLTRSASARSAHGNCPSLPPSWLTCEAAGSCTRGHGRGREDGRFPLALLHLVEFLERVLFGLLAVWHHQLLPLLLHGERVLAIILRRDVPRPPQLSTARRVCCLDVRGFVL